MAAGKPIITTTIGSNLEVASQKDTALLVSPGEPRALAQAITHSLEDPGLRSKLGNNARKVFESRYTEQRMLDSYMQLYLDLLKAKCPEMVQRLNLLARLAGSLETKTL
jgi:glycosyltransferase involved in cell wall biosynthesis